MAVELISLKNTDDKTDELRDTTLTLWNLQLERAINKGERIQTLIMDAETRRSQGWGTDKLESMMKEIGAKNVRIDTLDGILDGLFDDYYFINVGW